MTSWNKFIEDPNCEFLNWDMLLMKGDLNPDAMELQIRTFAFLQDIFREYGFLPARYPSAHAAVVAIESIPGFLTTGRWVSEPDYAVKNVAEKLKDYIQNAWPLDMQKEIAVEDEAERETIWEQYVRNYQFRVGLILRALLNDAIQALKEQFGILHPAVQQEEEKNEDDSLLGALQSRLLKQFVSEALEEIMESSPDSGTTALYLERVVQDDLPAFLNALDKLYDADNDNIELIRAFKCLHDFYHNNEVRYADWGNRNALTHYFEHTGIVNHQDFQTVIRGMLNKFTESMTPAEGVAAEQNRTADPRWRERLDLPEEQQVQSVLIPVPRRVRHNAIVPFSPEDFPPLPSQPPAQPRVVRLGRHGAFMPLFFSLNFDHLASPAIMPPPENADDDSDQSEEAIQSHAPESEGPHHSPHR